MSRQPGLKRHNVGPSRPLLAHADYVAYLFQCATLWYREPGGTKQAQNVTLMAERMQNVNACDICGYRDGSQ